MEIEIPFDCPECNREIKITSDKIGSSINCPYCDAKLDLIDNGIISALEEADSSINDMLKDLSDI